MTPELTNEVTASLLILWLASVIAIGILLSLMVVCLVKQRRAHQNSRLDLEEVIFPDSQRENYLPSLFERPCRWIVVRSSNLHAVQSALGLLNPIPCSWNEGLSRIQEHKLFLAPPVKGWILILGQVLPDPAEDIDECYRFILKLSRALGHVQFFSAHRAVNHHAWVQAEGDRVLRAYAWTGQTVWNQGKLTQAEKDLGLHCFGYGEAADGFEIPGRDSHQTNAEKVLFLAARWSFDPTSIGESSLPAAHGITGDLFHTKFH